MSRDTHKFLGTVVTTDQFTGLIMASVFFWLFLAIGVGVWLNSFVFGCFILAGGAVSFILGVVKGHLD